MKRRPIFYSLLPLLIIAIIVFGLYLGRDSLKERLLTLVSDRLQLSNLDIQGLRLDAEGMRAQSIHINQKDAQQDLDLTLEDVKLGFSLFPLDLSSLVVARAKLDVAVVTQNRKQFDKPPVNHTPTVSTQTGSTASAGTPGLPTQLVDLDSARINELTANIRLPDSQDVISFVGSADWTSDGDRVAIKLENNNEHITINSDTDLRAITMEISQPTDTTGSTRLAITDPMTGQPGFTITSELVTLNKWIFSSTLVPALLRSAVDQFQQTVDRFSVAAASFELAGGLDLHADWQLKPVTVDFAWTSLRYGDCQIDGRIHGTLSSTNSKTGVFAIDEDRSINANNCIDQSAEKISSQLQVRPKSGFSVTYDLTAMDDPAVDISGPIELNLEFKQLTAVFSSDNIQINDAWNEHGLPGTTNGTIATKINFRDFSKIFNETSVGAASLGVEGTFTLSQFSRDAPYDLRSDDLLFDIQKYQHRQPPGSIAIDHINGTGKATLNLTPSLAESFQIDGVIDMSTDIAVRDIELRNAETAASLNIASWDSNSQINGKVENGDPTIAMTLDYRSNTLSLSDPVVVADAVTGNAKIQLNDTLKMDTTVSISDLYGSPPLPTLSIDQLDGNLQLTGDQIDGSGIATLTTDLEVPWTLRKRSNRFVLGTSMSADFPVLYEWLKPALGTLAQSVNITDGNVRLDSELEIGDTDRLMVATASLTNLNGGFEDIKFNQATVTMNSTDLLAREIDLAVDVTNGEFANGTTFSDLSSNTRISGNKLTIDQFSTRSFDAGFVFNDLVIGDESNVPTSIVKVDGLDLAVVTSELGKGQLNASGKMSGEIPFRIVDRGVAIDDGHLESDSNGTIAYRSGGSDQNIEGLNNIALQALDNFQYDNVELDLNYTEEGEYLARFRLSGNNPELYDGYPIVLNLNINGQLPGLLRSSLIGGSFDEEILRTLPQDPTQQDN